MSDEEVFRPVRKKINPEEVAARTDHESPMDKIRQMQENVANETNDDAAEIPSHFKPNYNPDSGIAIKGNIPPEFQKILQQAQSVKKQPTVAVTQQNDEEYEPRPVSSNPKKPASDRANFRATGSEELESLLERLTSNVNWEEIELPSKGKFYQNIPETLHIRPMTGEEEQILATQRFVKNGKAIDMIFEKCIKEKIPTNQLLSPDRTFLLIYLRGISYTPEYDVEVKCPECGNKFNYTIDLNSLGVDFCPEDFTPESLSGTLPTSGFKYSYHLASGVDEQLVTKYRDDMIKEFGSSREDDTLIYRTAIMLDYIEGVNNKKELNLLIKKLPINDVAFLRNTINEPPFGVKTEIGISCAYCTEDFEIDMPLEANFFFPRKKEI